MKIDYEILKGIHTYGLPILSSSEYLKTMEFIQHGETTCFLHCIAVAYISLKIIHILRLKVNKKELIHSALLHDYFLYDWHKTGRIVDGKLHGFTHPKVACENAKRDFDINENEFKNIKCHMWPLTIVPPTKKEGWVLTLADKICATYETLHRNSVMIPLECVEKQGLIDKSLY